MFVVLVVVFVVVFVVFVVLVDHVIGKRLHMMMKY